MTDRKSWETSVSIYIRDFSIERMKELSAAGIHFIELTALYRNDLADFRQRAPEILAVAEANGVKIRSLHLPFAPGHELDPANRDKAIRDSFVKLQSEFIEIASKNGIEIAIVHPSCEPYAEEARFMHLEYSIQSLSAIQNIAKNSGVKLAIENLPRTCMGRDCREMKYILDSVDGAYACFDSNHSLYDPNPELIKTMGSKIIATHISDYDFIDERHLFPGFGKNDWELIMSSLEAVGYDGTWNYEIRDTHCFSAEAFKLNHNKLLEGKIR